MFQSKIATDRSFAETVQNQYTGSSQNNTHRAQETSRGQKRLGTHRRRDQEDEDLLSPRDLQNKRKNSSDSENSLDQDRMMIKEEHEDDDDEGMAASEISAIDSFAKTHY
jgi:hypothetical protein